MPVVTPFGDLTLHDERALKRWTTAHDARHQVYVKKGLGKGGTLEGPINGDWMLRHGARHTSIATTQKEKYASPNVKGLLLPGVWKTEQQLQDWHLLHNRLHSLIDKIADIRAVRARHGP
jgi:hypothetical protein